MRSAESDYLSMLGVVTIGTARQLWKLRCQCTVGPCMVKVGSTRATLIMHVDTACSTTVRTAFPLDCSGPLGLAVHRYRVQLVRSKIAERSREID